MFTDGDKIVCIDNSNKDRRRDMHNPLEYNPLELHKTYEVKRVIYGDSDHNYNYKDQVVVELFGVAIFSFDVNRFMLLSEYRRMKLNKIKNNIR